MDDDAPDTQQRILMAKLEELAPAASDFAERHRLSYIVVAINDDGVAVSMGNLDHDLQIYVFRQLVASSYAVRKADPVH